MVSNRYGHLAKSQVTDAVHQVGGAIAGAIPKCEIPANESYEEVR